MLDTEHRQAYELVRAYREAIENIREDGRKPSLSTMKRLSELKRRLKNLNNGQVKK